MRNFSKLNIDLRGHTSGRVKTFCPFCHEHRHDKRDKSLSVDIDKGLYKCHYCDAQGYVPDEDEERCRIVEWSADCKDANEELVKHGAESVITRVKAAKEMNDINGSADFGNMTDYCLCVDRDDDLKVVSVYVDKVKFKHLGTRGVAFFHYDGLSGRYVPCQLERVPKGVDLPEGNVPGRQGTVVVRNAISVKFYKTTDWRNFNIRWISDQGEAILASQLESFDLASKHPAGQIPLDFYS